MALYRTILYIYAYINQGVYRSSVQHYEQQPRHRLQLVCNDLQRSAPACPLRESATGQQARSDPDGKQQRRGEARQTLDSPEPETNRPPRLPLKHNRRADRNAAVYFRPCLREYTAAPLRVWTQVAAQTSSATRPEICAKKKAAQPLIITPRINKISGDPLRRFLPHASAADNARKAAAFCPFFPRPYNIIYIPMHKGIYTVMHTTISRKHTKHPPNTPGDTQTAPAAPRPVSVSPPPSPIL